MANNSLINDFLSAMEIIAKGTQEKATSTKLMEVTAVPTDTVATYTVKYEGTEYSNVLSSGGTYKVGDQVYVIWPEDNNAQKTIISALSSTNATTIENPDDLYEQVGNANVIDRAGDFYLNTSGSIILYEEDGENNKINVAQDWLKAYLQAGNGIKISADFKVDLPDDFFSADNYEQCRYGIRVYLDLGEGNNRVYELGIDQIEGYPYILKDFTPQSVIYPLSKEEIDNFEALTKIEFYVANYPNGLTDGLFAVQNIQLFSQILKKNVADDVFTIISKDGLNITGKEEGLILETILQSKYDITTDDGNAPTYKWYKKQKKYVEIQGANSASLEISQSDILRALVDYKCEVVYQRKDEAGQLGEYTLSAEVSIKNDNGVSKIEVIATRQDSENGNIDYYDLSAGTNPSISDVKYEWYSSENLNQQLTSPTIDATKISIRATYYAEAYVENSGNKEYLGTGSIDIDQLVYSFKDVINYYYATQKEDKNLLPEKGSANWKSSPDDTNYSKDYPYLWSYGEIQSIDQYGQTKMVSTTELSFVVWGAEGDSLQVQYQNAETIDKLNPNNWQSSMPIAESGKKTFMRQRIGNNGVWTNPIQISGVDGDTPTITINKEGYWVINGEATSVKAEGDTPTVEIKDGKWVINGSSTNIDATGPAGKDGTDIEYVYYRSEEAVNSWDNRQPNASEENGWKNSALGITPVYKYEYMSVRTKPAGINTSWTNFSIPVIWSKWGEKGIDGDGVEYKYYLKNEEVKPPYDASDTTNWKDEPTGVSISNKFEYVAVIATKYNDKGESDTTINVALWSKYSIDGTSPYSIELSNDSATIGTNASGSGYSATLLQTVSTIIVTVFEGVTNITDKCSFSWSVVGGTLNATSGSTNYFKTLTSDSAEATVTVKKDNNPIGSKTFTISKVKQGDAAVTYVLSVTPNSWNITENVSITPKFTVTKYIGDAASNITNGYQIKVNGTEWTGSTISNTTTFELWVNNIKVDSETVSAVKNGPEGIGVNKVESEVKELWAYIRTNDSINPPEPPTSNWDEITGNGDTTWGHTEVTSGYSNIWRWKSKQEKTSVTVTYSNGSTSSAEAGYSNWSAPELYGENIETLKTFNALTQNGKLKGIFYTDKDGKWLNEDQQITPDQVDKIAQLHINADMIKTGVLLVGDENAPLFKAGVGDKNVLIAGFEVGKTEKKDYLSYGKTSYNDANSGVYIGTDGIGLGNGKFYVKNDGILNATGANISGAINATTLTIGTQKQSLSSVAISGKYEDLSDPPFIPVSVEDLKGADNIIYAEDVSISESIAANGTVQQTISVGDKKYTSIIDGDFVLTNIGLGTDTTDGSQSYTRISKDGLLTAKNAIIYGTIYATNGKFEGEITATKLTLGQNTTIPAGSVNGLSSVATSGNYGDLTGQPNLSAYATSEELNKYVTNDSLSNQLNGYAKSGELSAYLKTSDLEASLGKINVAYRGDVTTTSSTDNTTGITTTTYSYIGLDGKTYDTTTYTTEGGNYVLLNRNNVWNPEGDTKNDKDGKNLVKISTDGLLTAKNAVIAGTIYATDGEFTGHISSTSGDIGNWNITENGLTTSNVGLLSKNSPTKASLLSSNSTSPIRIYCGGTATTATNAPFAVLDDGSLYATAAYFSGGNVTIDGNVIIGGKTVSQTHSSITNAQNTANNAQNTANNAQNISNSNSNQIKEFQNLYATEDFVIQTLNKEMDKIGPGVVVLGPTWGDIELGLTTYNFIFYPWHLPNKESVLLTSPSGAYIEAQPDRANETAIITLPLRFVADRSTGINGISRITIISKEHLGTMTLQFRGSATLLLKIEPAKSEDGYVYEWILEKNNNNFISIANYSFADVLFPDMENGIPAATLKSISIEGAERYTA